MLCLEDCLALCDLTEDEVLAIAHHEHIPEMVAAELGNYLARTPQGELRIKNILRELGLKLLLRNFVLQHPCCEERHRRQLVAMERRA